MYSTSPFTLDQHKINYGNFEKNDHEKKGKKKKEINARKNERKKKGKKERSNKSQAI